LTFFEELLDQVEQLIHRQKEEIEHPLNQDKWVRSYTAKFEKRHSRHVAPVGKMPEDGSDNSDNEDNELE